MSKKFLEKTLPVDSLLNAFDCYTVQLVHLNTLPGFFHLHPAILAVVAVQGSHFAVISTSHSVRGLEHKLAHPRNGNSMRTTLELIGKRYASTFLATYEGYVGRSVCRMAREAV
jgi:hypothetical protein